MVLTSRVIAGDPGRRVSRGHLVQQTYRIISVAGLRCEPSLTVRELFLISQVLERIAAWCSQYRCCRAAAQQPDEPSQPARAARQLSHANSFDIVFPLCLWTIEHIE